MTNKKGCGMTNKERMTNEEAMTNKWGMKNMHQRVHRILGWFRLKWNEARPRRLRGNEVGGNIPADWVTATASTVNPLHAWVRSAFNIPVLRYGSICVEQVETHRRD
jgi:hypothetical protein